jgi:hypothetical protein
VRKAAKGVEESAVVIGVGECSSWRAASDPAG